MASVDILALARSHFACDFSAKLIRVFGMSMLIKYCIGCVKFGKFVAHGWLDGEEGRYHVCLFVRINFGF